MGNRGRSMNSNTIHMNELRREANKRKKRMSGKRRVDRWGIDPIFLLLTLSLVVLGLVALFSASYAYAYYNHGDSFYFIKKQILYAIMGVSGMLFIGFFINYKIIEKLAVIIYGGALGILLIRLLMPSDAKGTKRWLIMGPINFQPSEIAKFAVIAMFAYLIAKNYHRMNKEKYGFWPFVILLGIMVGPVFLAKHLSATIIITTIGLMLIFIGSCRLRPFIVLGTIGGVVGVAGLWVGVDKIIPWASDRVSGWLDPFAAETIQSTTYQTVQSLYAISSGGVFGVGLGNSRQKFLYLPEPQNDFVFSIWCEEMGFVGAFLIMLLFTLLVWRGMVIATRSQDKFGSFLVMGISLQIGLQSFLNIAVATNTIPNTGISLPFFSYGGSSLIMILLQMGVVLSVSRYNNLKNIVEDSKEEFLE